MMRIFAAISLFLCLNLVVQGAFGQQDDPVDPVRETIKAGSSKELAKYLAPTLNVSIENKVNSYSKSQAEFVLRDFFKQHPPKDFIINHQGSSRSGIPYAVGEYKSGTETYLVYITFKSYEQKFLVSEIRFSL